MAFQPGQSGNPSGRSKERPFRDALMLELKSGDDPASVPRNSIRAVARALIERAIADKDVPAAREIADRIDGKVPQAVVGDSDHDPVAMTIEGLFQRVAEQGKRVFDK